jgi:hypothetical protein
MRSSCPGSATRATASSVAVVDRTGGLPRHLIVRYGPALALAIVVGAMAATMYAARRAGHWWGDDWALYLRQAKGLLDGHPNRVLTENEFTVFSSEGPEFSPPLYPWGFPLLLAPFVAVLGDDLDRLVIVPVLCACVFACCWFDLAKRRIGYLPALVGIPAVTLTPLLLSWSELIQSEWPFLAAAGVALVCLDRAAAGDRLVGDRATWKVLALVGLAAAAAFSVRREGLAMVGAIGVAQLSALAAMRPRPWALRGVRLAHLLSRLALPYATFLAAAGLLQALLPSTVVPRYDGTSITNVWTLRDRLFRNLAQVSGLQRPWDRDPIVLGSATLGSIAMIAFLVLAALGVLLTLWRDRTRDLHLAAYAIGAFLIGGSFRSPINRYVATVGPVLMLLALLVVFVVVRRLTRPVVATAVMVIALLAIVAGNVANAHLRVESAARAADAGAIEWGPMHPDATAMFDAVERLTGPDDVVGAPKARAMVLETRRDAVQVDDFRPVPTDVNVALLVVERGTRLATTLAGDQDWRAVWENPRFVLYQPRAPLTG